jgi:hypothetical protein
MTRGLPAVLLCVGLLRQAPAPAAPLPDAQAFFGQVVKALRADARLQAEYTYIERRRDVEISRLGKVTVGPLETFEVYPSIQPGRTYKRRIAVDGKPLSPDELAAADEEHRRELAREEEKRERESPGDRATREAREADARDWREEILDDALAVFEPTIVGRERIGGEPVVKVRLAPRAQARTKTREGGWMKQFAGYAWFSEHNHQVVRVQMEARDDVSVGWGIVGRLHKGSRIEMSRRKVGDNWLPSRFTFEGSGRTLLFRKFDVSIERTYSNFTKVGASASRDAR